MRWLPLALLLACGGGPRLSNLRCRGTCQDVESPLKVLLAVDFTDETGTLDQGVLNLRVDGNTQQTVTLSDVFAAQNVPAGSKKGTLNVDQDMMLDRLAQGQKIRVSLEAVNGKGQSSNEPGLTFAVHLGQSRGP